MTIPWRLSRPALPGRSAASLADCISQFVRRLTTKELVFLRFLALRNARVNGKKQMRPCLFLALCPRARISLKARRKPLRSILSGLLNLNPASLDLCSERYTCSTAVFALLGAMVPNHTFSVVSFQRGEGPRKPAFTTVLNVSIERFTRDSG